MKKFILTLLILTAPYLVNAQASKKSDMIGKIGISFYGGGNIPAAGDYSSNLKTTALLSVGSQFGFGASYFITKGFAVEGTINIGYNYYRSKYKPEGKEPVWVNHSASLNAIYNFGHLFRNPVVSPFARIGAGSYKWVHFEDGIIGGDVTKENKNYDVSSFGFNVGAGAEYFVTKKFTVGLLLDYTMFFPKREEQLTGENSTADDRIKYGFFSPQIKLSYYVDLTPIF